MTLTNSSYLYLFMICVGIAIVKPRTHLSHIVGDEVKLGCDLITDPEGKIVWKAGPRLLFAGDLRIRRDRRLSLDNNDLVISSVGGGDGGEYSCETEILGGDVLMMVTYLDILSPPSVHILGGEGLITVKSGASLSLTCKGMGVPIPQVTWIMKGKVMASSIGTATAVLNNVEHKDAGDITCKADNGVGDVAEYTATLHILGPPSIILSKSTYDCSLRLKCSSQSSPQALLHWWYNGLLLGSNNNQVKMISSPSGLTLLLDVCGMEGVGDYVCEAENRFGVDRKSYNLTREMVLGVERDNREFNFIYRQALPLVSLGFKQSLGNVFVLILILLNYVNFL